MYYQITMENGQLYHFSFQDHRYIVEETITQEKYEEN